MDWQDRQISSGAGEGRVSNPSVLSLAVRQFSTTALERTPRDFCPARYRRDAQLPRRHTRRNVFQVMSGRFEEMLGRRICHSPLLARCLLLAQWKEQGVFQQK